MLFGSVIVTDWRADLGVILLSVATGLDANQGKGVCYDKIAQPLKSKIAKLYRTIANDCTLISFSERLLRTISQNTITCYRSYSTLFKSVMLISNGTVPLALCLYGTINLYFCIGACGMFRGEFGVCAQRDILPLFVLPVWGVMILSNSCFCFGSCTLVVWLSAGVLRSETWCEDDQGMTMLSVTRWSTDLNVIYVTSGVLCTATWQLWIDRKISRQKKLCYLISGVKFGRCAPFLKQNSCSTIRLYMLNVITVVQNIMHAHCLFTWPSIKQSIRLKRLSQLSAKFLHSNSLETRFWK